MKAIKIQLWYGLLALGILLGLLTGYRVLIGTGFVLYAKTDILVWTMPIAAYVFFSLTSTGLAFVSSIPVVFGIKRYQPLEKRTAFLEIAVLAASFTCLLLHLGSPWNVIYYIISPNLASPLWWLGMLYGLYLVVLLLSFRKISYGPTNSFENSTLKASRSAFVLNSWRIFWMKPSAGLHTFCMLNSRFSNFSGNSGSGNKKQSLNNRNAVMRDDSWLNRFFGSMFILK